MLTETRDRRGSLALVSYPKGMIPSSLQNRAYGSLGTRRVLPPDDSWDFYRVLYVRRPID